MKQLNHTITSSVMSIILLSSVVATRAQLYPGAGQYTPDASTVFLWHLNDGTGTNAVDATTNHLNGTTGSTYTPNLSWGTGRYGGGVVAANAGTNSHGYVARNMDGSALNSGFTFDMWFETANPGSGQVRYLGGFDSIGAGGDLFYVRLLGSTTNTGAFTFGILDLPSYVEHSVTTTNLVVFDGNWHQVAVSYAGATLEVYLDNVLVASQTASPSLNFAAGTFSVAGNAPWAPSAAGAGTFAGSIDEVRLSDIVVTDFSSGGVAYTTNANTVLLWHLDDGAGTVAHDATVNYLDGTLKTPSPRWTTSGVFSGGIDADASNPNGYLGLLLNGSVLNSGFTFDTWLKVNTNTSPSNGKLLYLGGFDSTANGGDLFYVRIHDIYDPVNAYVQFGILNLPSWTFTEVGSSTIAVFDNQWHQYAAAYDGTTMKLYQDNVEILSTAGPTSCNFLQGLLSVAGSAPWAPAGGTVFSDSFDEVRLSSIARTNFAAPLTAPQITGIRVDNQTNVVVSFLGSPGCTHDLQWLADVSGTNWSTVISNVPYQAGTMQLTNSVTPAIQNRFYRVKAAQ
jgi:hypothetical protein